jgi:DNA invertase Pin-like site-specific DNA recombinase
MNNFKKYASYLRTVKCGKLSEEYLTKQLTDLNNYLTSNNYEDIKSYKDSNADGYFIEFKNLIEDINTGSVNHVIIYSPYIFEEMVCRTKILVDTMDNNNCKLTILNEEDIYFEKFLSIITDDGNLDRFYRDIEESASLLISYSKK